MTFYYIDPNTHEGSKISYDQIPISFDIKPNNFDNLDDNEYFFCTRHIKELDDSINFTYHGIVSSDNLIINQQLSSSFYHCYKKRTFIVNPPIVLDRRILDDRIYYIIRDDLLPGGTKQRGYKGFSHIDKTELIYPGTWNGAAQVALAICCKLLNKKATVFLTDDSKSMTIKAIVNGAKILVPRNCNNIQCLRDAAKSYSNTKFDSYLLEKGFSSNEFKDSLIISIIECIEGIINRDITSELWVTGGSGTLLSSLYIVFPNAQFRVVQVGAKIWDDQLDITRTIKYISSEKFYDDAIEQPPYPTVSSYDAKLWYFFKRYSTNNAMIWNVASD